MRVFFVFIILILNSFSYSFAQSLLKKRINLDVYEEKFSNILDIITEESDIFFSYNSELFPADQKFTLKVKDTPVEEVLNRLLVGTGINYAIFKDQIIFNLPAESTFKYSVKGVILDSLTNEPIANAHVYLDGTEIGAYTNMEGIFQFSNVTKGTYELVISHINYGVKNYYLYVNKGLDEFTLSIPPKVVVLDEFKVLSAKNKFWNVYYSIFVEEFIGSSVNSEKCIIKNPEAVRILFDSTDSYKEFEVFTTEPLIIHNEALGYKLNYDLIFFKSKAGVIRYVGKTNFDALSPEETKGHRRWKKKRYHAYTGSLRHFIQAEMTDELKQNKFRTQIVDEVPELVELKYYPANLKSKEMIRLKNICESLPVGKYIQVLHGSDKISYIGKLDTTINREYMRFDEYFDLSDGIMVYGYWSKQRLADALPLSFYLSLEE